MKVKNLLERERMGEGKLYIQCKCRCGKFAEDEPLFVFIKKEENDFIKADKGIIFLTCGECEEDVFFLEWQDWQEEREGNIEDFLEEEIEALNVWDEAEIYKRKSKEEI